MIPLRTFFTFAAEHEALLRALFEHRDGLSGAALRRLAAELRGETGPSPETVIQRLFDYGIIEERASESLMLELTRPVRDFLGHLLQSHELVTPEVIRGYLSELDNESRKLAEAASANDEQLALLSLEKLVSAIERVRHYAHINQMAILERVLRIKNHPERFSVRERFLRINDLWSHYLVPLRALIELGGAAHATFDGTERELGKAGAVFRYQAALHRALRETEVRLQRMRTDVTTAFTEAYREVLPLYEKLRRQDGIARGAAALLETLAGSGPRELAARTPLPLVRFRMLGQINDAEMIARPRGRTGLRSPRHRLRWPRVAGPVSRRCCDCPK